MTEGSPLTPGEYKYQLDEFTRQVVDLDKAKFDSHISDRVAFVIDASTTELSLNR